MTIVATTSSTGSLSVEVAAREFPSNRGAMCRKGYASAELLTAKERLTAPLLRKERGGPLQPVSWDTALNVLVDRIRTFQAESGRDAIAAFGGGGLTNETAYMLGKFVRVVLGSKNIDYNGRFCMASAAVAGQRAFGIDRGLPFPLADLPAVEVILLVGGNPAETMPPIMQYFDAQRAAGGELVVVDPRRTATAEFATRYLPIAPGTDAALANGLLYVALRDHLLDEQFIREKTTGFAQVRQHVAQYWPDRVERITGIAAQEIVDLAHRLGKAKSACVLTARGAEQQSRGVHNVQALINLVLALGHVGKPGSGFGCLTGQGNGQGGREHGQKADQLPGYRQLSNPEHREAVARVWQVNAGDLPGPGPSACELIDSLGSGSGPRALIVMGSNLMVSAPDVAHVEQKLRALELLVVADTFLSETAALADIVLPVCHWAEHDGTLTNLEGRLLRRRRALPPPDGVRTDLEILELVAQRLGKERFVSANPQDVFDELARASKGGVADYSGFSHARLDADDGLFWPCRSPEHAGTPRLFADGFPTPDGRARFHVAPFLEPVERVDEEFPLYLTTGRLLAHYQTGNQTHRVPSLEAAEPEPFVQIHPELARTFGIGDGDWVTLRTRRGRVVVRAKHSASLRLDTVFLPFHWGGTACANTLTSRTLDPSSKIPEFKLSAVSVQRLEVQA